MESTRYRGLLLVLVLQHGPIHSLVSHVPPPRPCRHGVFSPESITIAPTLPSQPRGTRYITAISRTRTSPMAESSRGDYGDTPSWHSVRARAVIATILATAVVFTGVVPAWEVGFGSMEHSQTTARVASVGGGVRSASAASFNDEQRAIAETWRTVDRLYVDRTFAGQDWFGLRQQALKDAAKGMTEAELNVSLAKLLASLGDRYTKYLPPAKYATIVQSSSGDVAGVGVSLSFDVERDLPLVVGIEKGTPAEEAGLQAGDLLLQISGDECRGLTPDDAAALLRGTENTKVGIVAERGASAAAGGGGRGGANVGKGEKLDLIVTRRKFKVEGVVSKEANIDGRSVGIIRIKSFSSNTVGDVQAAMDRFKSKGVNRLVVDLRGNVGGLLPAGIDTAGLFLDSGKDVVFIIRKNGSVEARTTMEAGPAAKGPPLTLLVDKGTASAAEVFAAAVRENGRATLVGERTFGKGVIQTVEPLTSGGGVAVTVARYETPLHNNINKVGIPVDKAIDCPASRDSAECDI